MVRPAYINSVILAFLVFSQLTGYGHFAHARSIDELPDTAIPWYREPQNVTERFLKCVDRGNLVIFDQTINKTMISPIHVEYIYELDTTIPRIKVYSEMITPIPIPEQVEYVIKGISAHLDHQGRIISTEIHIKAAE